MIVLPDQTTARDFVRVCAAIELVRGIDCWPWKRDRARVIFAGGRTWRVRTFLRRVFRVESHEITSCAHDQCVYPYHTFVPAPV